MQIDWSSFVLGLVIGHGMGMGLLATWIALRRMDRVGKRNCSPYAPFEHIAAPDYVDVNPDHPLARGLVGGIIYGADGKGRFIRIPGREQL